MTELELEHLRREKWRLDGEPVRTLDEAREFVDSVGLCLLYPTRPAILLPTFVGSTIGDGRNLPPRQKAFTDPRTQVAEDFRQRLVRDKFAYEGQLQGEALLLSPSVFPYFYALASDRKPRQPIMSRGGKTSLLTEHVFRKLEESGPLNRKQLQEMLGGALSGSAVDRALLELWGAVKIAPIDHQPQLGDTWDVYYRWALEAVTEGVRISDAEALSALISKYLDCVVAATQEEIEAFFSIFTSRARVAEVLRAMLDAREFIYSPSETRTLITVAGALARGGASRVQSEHEASLARRRRNG